MAVKTITDAIHLQCLSSDTKLIAANGSTLHVVDTGEQFIAHDGDWVEDRRLLSVLLTYHDMIS